MINGIINVYKEAGYTSHDVVAKLRGICKQKKIGHTGTLDPDATGVLPVCFGDGTKLCDMITDKSKEYIAEFQLGYITDTQDISGKILQEYKVDVTKEQVKEAILSFVGNYEQIPPMYSAIKVDGKKLYELARQGKVIERKSRSIFIESIEIMEINIPMVVIKAKCSKGTYIRTLCQDIGEKLGCGATMSKLVRTKVGNFCIEDAITISEIETLRQDDLLSEKLVTLEQVFIDLPQAKVKTEYRKFIDNGNTLFFHQVDFDESQKKNEMQIRIYNDENRFCGIYQLMSEIKTDNEESEKFEFLKPVKMFPNT